MPVIISMERKPCNSVFAPDYVTVFSEVINIPNTKQAVIKKLPFKKKLLFLQGKMKFKEL